MDLCAAAQDLCAAAQNLCAAAHSLCAAAHSLCGRTGSLINRRFTERCGGDTLGHNAKKPPFNEPFAVSPIETANGSHD